MKILLKYTSSYGRHLWYPVNDEAKKLLQIFNKKSLVLDQVKGLVDLGFEVDRVPEAPKKLFDHKDKTEAENATT